MTVHPQSSTAPPAEEPPAPAAGGSAHPAPLAPRLPGFRGTFAWGLVRALRPRQWVKNVLVLAAPLAAGEIFNAEVMRPTAVAFLLFCLSASAVYLVNDTIDVEEDRRHPRKRFRPIAAGIVPRWLALAMAAVLLVVALTAAALLTRPELAFVLGSYVVIQLAYCVFLKNQPVIDLAVVASGFLLRGIAGGVAAGLLLSQWFLLVAAFGSLFMVAGKRYSELVLVGDAAATRKTLKEYSPSYLRFVWSLSAGVAVTAYSLWAFEMGETQDGVPWSTISIAPFVMAILRYAVDVDRGAAGAPEEIVLRDRVLLFLGVLWVVTMALGVFDV
ncbi:decaprenyl-phosphate phosphoribosyltransferase [Blastococcus sp. TML/M2B]|uniref:decaprenyl-phosphate phosphoribosyltransferase n=1 Tax=unclassified Blastococcus TaxID=2619396 RepID=UPI00190DAF52|nr:MULTISPECIES: decaprenyl-phosphate phosphoribosyltransferase [unclassified Blastococcus]MBN1093828.1 decaprenyl-phosphate phosphoribosyltransferase [Blastococcus sp. TML/M2B]MBN1096048.1 decaprenyl-phosphate phosphoribosyltransferase [Blastococcus sp. TML/C7B]